MPTPETSPDLVEGLENSNEVQNYTVSDLIAMKRDELMAIVLNWWRVIQVLKAQEIKKLVAKLFWIWEIQQRLTM